MQDQLDLSKWDLQTMETPEHSRGMNSSIITKHRY